MIVLRCVARARCAICHKLICEHPQPLELRGARTH